MIAAGSLFTSCIEQVEPEGIRNMRDAKADYIRSLKDINAADAEFRRAEAEVERAKSRLIDAKAARETEKANYQKMLNEKQQLLNEALAMDNEQKAAAIAKEIAKLEQEMKEFQRQAEIDEITHQQALAEAQHRLDQALREMEFAANDLTENEKKALIAAAGAYYATIEALAMQNMKVAGLEAELEDMKAKYEKEYEQALKDSTMVWDKESLKYVTKIEDWQNKIDNAKKQIAENNAKLEAAPDPTIADIDKWDAEVKAYKDSAQKIDVELKNVQKEAAAYYGSTVHEGVKKYNQAIDLWMNEHPEFDENTVTVGTEVKLMLTPANAILNAWYKNEPKKENYTKDYVFKVEDLELTKDSPTYLRFEAMLNDYNDKDIINFNDGVISINPEYVVNGKKIYGEEEIEFTNGNDNKVSTYYLKDFILGDTTVTVDNSQWTLDTIFVKNRELGKDGDAKDYEDGKLRLTFEYPTDTVVLRSNKIETGYGLKGALSVLNRSLVTKEESKATQEELDEALEAAEANWTAYRKTLVDGLKNYNPYKVAIEKNLAAVDTLNAAKAADTKVANDVIAAIVNLVKTFEDNKTTDIANISAPAEARDVFNAISAFAKAREALDYEYDATKDNGTPKVGNKKLFYYGQGQDAEGVTNVFSVKFSEMTQADVIAEKSKYRITYDGDGKTSFNIGDYPALAYMAQQLFGSTQVTEITSTANLNASNALYEGKYAYTPADEQAKKKAVFAQAGKDSYTSKATNDADVKIKGNQLTGEDKIYGTREAVADSIKAYIKVYGKFWGLVDYDGAKTAAQKADKEKEYANDIYTEKLADKSNKSIEDAVATYFAAIGKTTGNETEASTKAALELFVDGDKDNIGALEYKASCYDKETFTVPYYMVFFKGNDVVETSALHAVLHSVDPKYSKENIVENCKAAGSAILEPNGMFYAWMKAYSDANAGESAKDIAAIEAWVKKVEEAFEAAEKVAAEPDAEFYAEAKKMYDNAVYVVENYDTMLADWIAFVGEDYTVKVNGEIDTLPRNIKYMRGKTLSVDNWYEGFYFAETVFTTEGDIYTGAWDTTGEKGISGQLLKNAQEFLPNLPENVKAWANAEAEAKDKIEHVTRIQEKAELAYLAAAKLANYDKDILEAIEKAKKEGKDIPEINDWTDLMRAYEFAQKNYVDELKGDNKKLENKINKWSKQMADFDANPTIETLYDGDIKELEAEIAEAKMLIEPLTKAKELAKANYDKVLDYIKAQDFTFIDFSNIFDLVNQMFPGVGNDILSKLQGLIMGYLN